MIVEFSIDIMGGFCSNKSNNKNIIGIIVIKLI